LGRACTICSHRERYEIDGFLAERSKSYRDIALHYGVSKDAVSRHVSGGHISELIALAADAERAARADSLLDRIEALQSQTMAILDNAEDQRTALAAVAQARNNLSLIGEVTRELDRAPTINLAFNPEWIELRTLIVGALDPFPDARESVLQAIKGAGNGRP
jgi:DNA-binding transcriptional ArsR family regulator